ncbi:cytochrome o ubiquinol oxidase [Nakamurella endophytica]|uniref:Cytochrome o ubiquinol oxidase n=2 Tax=Nakamurella endophytica TaxID=1748367 RepID=A0A917WJA7_9ACTN|nr:cytochrome o ubiquinol oxidase [Nakamurella endophytica]
MAILPGWLDPSHLIQSTGSWAVVVVMAILFAECGLLIGFFLPGDTLLFIAGLFVAEGSLRINLVLFIALLWVAAFAGNMVGYAIGYKVGPAVFRRPDAKFLKPEYIERSQAFFDRYGKVTVVLARFVPVVRTVATVMAGASRMNVRIYTVYSAIGGLLWVAAVTLAGYFLGQIDFVKNNVDVIFVAAVVIVVLVSAVPALLHMAQRRRAGRP